MPWESAAPVPSLEVTVAKKRDIAQLNQFINALLLPGEEIEFKVIASVDMPLFYVLTNRRLIGSHLYESGAGVNTMSVGYPDISAIAIDDDGPNDRIFSEVVARDINVFGSFGRLWLRIRDDQEGVEMYRRLVDKVFVLG
jgi:hypothetical protein